MRKIIHIDMDAFFASVEQRDHPEYRDRPLIVGGDPDQRGVVAACSYEARNYGIHSAMPASRARRFCPEAIFVRPRMEVYRKVSEQIRAIFRHYTDQVEPLSLDEAYLDVTESELFKGSATLIARDIKRAIFQETQLTASAGVSYNKFLAKMASDMDKPDGLYLITPAQGEKFVEDLAIGKFYGIGKATEAKMKSLGIHTGRELRKWSEEDLVRHFGKVGHHYYLIARGIDKRPVNPVRIRKSLGKEQTYATDLDNPAEMQRELETLAANVATSLHEKELAGHTFTIKIKYDNFELITRSQTIESPLDLDTMNALIPELLAKTEAGRRKVRLLGVSVSKLVNRKGEFEKLQKKLFEQEGI